jgi:MtN3 and saliva related transmembrane protein
LIYRPRFGGCGIRFFERLLKQLVSTIEIVGIGAGICTSISLLPQLVKLLRTKKAEDISLFYLIILMIGLALWIWYGSMREDIPIIVTNSFSLLLNVVIIVVGIKFKRQNGNQHDD